jgi:hypothetical protein
VCPHQRGSRLAQLQGALRNSRHLLPILTGPTKAQFGWWRENPLLAAGLCPPFLSDTRANRVAATQVHKHVPAGSSTAGGGPRAKKTLASITSVWFRVGARTVRIGGGARSVARPTRQVAGQLTMGGR